MAIREAMETAACGARSAPLLPPRLAAAFVHGIRNPLNTLSLSLQFLERLAAREADPARRADLLRRVEAASAEAGRIERMVAAFAELSAPAEARPERVDLARAAADAAAEARAAGARVEVRAREPVEARADTALLRAAIAALIENAREAAPPGEAIEIEVSRGPGGEARVEVRDRGPGFTEPALARVPELFFTTKPGRLGTGLARAERCAAAHGGRLEVRNRGGKGEGGGGASVAIVLGGRDDTIAR